MSGRKQKQDPNLLDYVKANVEPIRRSNLNNLDFAVFCMISYYNLKLLSKYKHKNKLTKVITLKDLFNLTYFETLFSKSSNPDSDLQVFISLAANPRFQNLEIRYFRDKLDMENTEEFDALTLKGEDFKVVVYQGTTPKSYYGFKEDFDMTYLYPIPSQISAKRYLEYELLFKDKLPVYLAGHSKGGNLALYAYDNINVKQKLKDRIKGIYAYDSPGIEGRSYYYLKLQGFLKKFVPKSSIIGMIFENKDVVDVVKASGGTADQHSLLNWSVDLEANDFVYEENLSDSAIKFATVFGEYIEGKNKEDREYLINLLFSLIKDQLDGDNKISINVLDLYKDYRQLKKSKSKEESEKIKKLVLELVTTIIKGII